MVVKKKDHYWIYAAPQSGREVVLRRDNSRERGFDYSEAKHIAPQIEEADLDGKFKYKKVNCRPERQIWVSINPVGVVNLALDKNWAPIRTGDKRFLKN